MLCKGKVGYHNSTTNLSQHLLGKHKKEFDILYGSDKGQLKLAYSEFRMSKKTKQALDSAIAFMMAADMQPISFVENTGFQNLMKTAVPGNNYYLYSFNFVRIQNPMSSNFYKDNFTKYVQRREKCAQRWVVINIFIINMPQINYPLLLSFL